MCLHMAFYTALRHWSDARNVVRRFITQSEGVQDKPKAKPKGGARERPAPRDGPKTGEKTTSKRGKVSNVVCLCCRTSFGAMLGGSCFRKF